MQIDCLIFLIALFWFWKELSMAKLYPKLKIHNPKIKNTL